MLQCPLSASGDKLPSRAVLLCQPASQNPESDVVVPGRRYSSCVTSGSRSPCTEPSPLQRRPASLPSSTSAQHSPRCFRSTHIGLLPVVCGPSDTCLSCLSSKCVRVVCLHYVIEHQQAPPPPACFGLRSQWQVLSHWQLVSPAHATTASQSSCSSSFSRACCCLSMHGPCHSQSSAALGEACRL